jgi:multidrug efflux pump subunit AcrA (membrane-fusion protein)
MAHDSSVTIPIEARLEITPGARRRRRFIRWSIWLVVVAAVVAGAAAAARSMRTPTPTRYQTEPVQRGPLTVTVTATGDVQSLTEVKVGTEISGIVETVSVDFNSRVTRGQVLAKVNTDKLEAQAQQLKAALESARADVANAEAAVEDTRRAFERSQALFERTLVSRSDRDAAEAASKKAEATRLSAVARVGQAEANVSALDTDLKRAYIRSPIDGIVLDRQIDPGQTVAASFQTPVLFTLSQDLTRMKLSVNVDEADIGEVRVGQSATFRVERGQQGASAAAGNDRHGRHRGHHNPRHAARVQRRAPVHAAGRVAAGQRTGRVLPAAGAARRATGTPARQRPAPDLDPRRQHPDADRGRDRTDRWKGDRHHGGRGRGQTRRCRSHRYRHELPGLSRWQRHEWFRAHRV